MRTSTRALSSLALSAVATGLLASSVHAAGVDLPRTVVWSAYPTGTSGYSQAVALGSVLQNEYGTNLRVIPGRNDISRLSPLRGNRVQFAAGGSEGVYAQEGMLDFSHQGWGPQPLRIVLWNISDGCSFTLATAEDAGIDSISDIRGKRVTYVQGAPSLNNATAALLSYGDLTWDDVQRVDVSGYMGSIEAVIENRADAVGGSCNSAPFLRIESSPRGLKFATFPHDDAEAVKRVTDRLPWYVPHVATDGPTIDPDEGIEVFTSPYPMLTTMADQEEALVYSMTKAMVEHYEDYKDNAPGAVGWALERQGLETAFVPFHDGAVRYFKEIGVWTDAAEERRQENLRRQEVLMEAWEQYTAGAPTDEQAFREGWMEHRAKVLRENDMVLIAERW